ncbi:hypothetical protein VTN77DRAFT_2365 [Rasamsonia byssochlamydoides]|uniref:uncharacterized protein n=1 Tax=Rasamsonia byssochlamydoides TaxID=89139 RepID=UPI0037429BE8
MPTLWRPEPRRPPSPLVEDEFEALSHELGGLSLLGEKPGVEGVCERGTIDQYPILLDIETEPPPRSASADSNASQQSLTSKSSRETLSPPTPPPPESRSPSSKTQINGFHQNHTVPHQPSTSHTTLRKNSSKDVQTSASASSHSTPTSRTGSHAVSQPKRGRLEDSESPRSSKRPTVAELIEKKLKSRRDQQAAKQVDEKRSVAREDKQKEQICPSSGAVSSASAPQSPRSPYEAGSSKSSSQVSILRSMSASPRSPHEVGSSKSSSQVSILRSMSASPRSPHEVGSSKSSSQVSILRSMSASPRSPHEVGSSKSSSQVSILRSMSASPRSPHEVGSPKSSSQVSLLRSMSASPRVRIIQDTEQRPRSASPSNGATRPSTPRDRRVVSFADEIDRPRSSSPLKITTRPVSDLSPSRPSRTSSPLKEDTTDLSLRPCPRSVPVAGHQDWYTISGLDHLNICPSCMKQLGQSRFRDYFVPSPPKPRDVKVRCSFSEPWTRLAWLQTIKKKHDNLEMLYQITRPPPGSKPCPGRTSSVQTWYRVIDPETGMNLPKFVACSACVRNLRILMPPLWDTFRWSPLVQERVCDLAVDSPRFVRYLDLLDAAANQCEDEGLPTPDHTEFVDYVRRKCGLRDCRRDRLILSPWHYIPELPEFSICEDCYDDVVRPLAAAHKPVARMVLRTPRLLPGSAPGRCREASCQLYSPRMRTRFREAVLRDDFQYLRSVALKRYDAEQRFRDRKQQLLYDESRGYDRDAELRQNAEEWKRWE